MMWARLMFLLLAAAAVLGAPSPPSPSTLVVVSNGAQRSELSGWVRGLTDRFHHRVTVVDAQSRKTSGVYLIEYGERLYDNLAIFAPNDVYTVSEIVKFVELGGNVLVATSKPQKALRELANRCGFDFDADDTVVNDDSHPLRIDFAGPAFGVVSRNAIGIVDHKPVAYRGIAQVRSQMSASEMALVVLPGQVSTYSSVPGEKSIESAGDEVVLISALQARNNARITITGSSELFSDAFAAIPSCGNREFALQLSAWTFGQRGQLRASNVHHHRVDRPGDKVPPKQYTVNDTVVYHVDIETFDGESNKWKPFVANDVQLEFVMMDPYIRLGLQASKSGHYTATFTVPDIYGVYKFRVEYERHGLSTLSLSTIVPVHPKRHDEYERFIFAAYPYYTSVFSMMGGFLLFAIVYLHHKD